MIFPAKRSRWAECEERGIANFRFPPFQAAFFFPGRNTHSRWIWKLIVNSMVSMIHFRMVEEKMKVSALSTSRDERMSWQMHST